MHKATTATVEPTPRQLARAKTVYKTGLKVRKSIIASLSPELLKTYWRKKAKNQHKTFGHCYCAAEALWHMLGGKASGYLPHVLSLPRKETHWYLRCKLTGKRLDPTSAQFKFKGKPIHYENGRPCGFLTKAPSNRARILIKRARKRLRSS